MSISRKNSETDVADSVITSNQYVAAPNMLQGRERKCSVCDFNVDCKVQGIQCYKCKNWFHAVGCRDETLCVSSTTAFSTQFLPAISKTGGFAKKFGRFFFLCDYCDSSSNSVQLHTDTEAHTNTIDSSDIMGSVNKELEKFKSDIISSIKVSMTEIIDAAMTNSAIQNPDSLHLSTNLNNTAENLPSACPNLVSRDYATVAANMTTKEIDTPIYLSNHTVIKTPTNSDEEVVILSNIEDTNCAPVDQVKKSVSAKFKKVPFVFANDKSKSKKIAVKFPDSQSRDKGVKILNEGDFLSSFGYKHNSAQKMLPKITLNGVPRFILHGTKKPDLSNDQVREAEKSAIISELLDKNHCLEELVTQGHTLQVVYLTNTSGNSVSDLTVGLKVSPSIRAVIISKQSGFVFLGGKRILFKDRFYVKQCYHCQKLGHVSTDCPQKQENPTCLYCMGNHRSSFCTAKQKVDYYACAKCYTSNNSELSNNYRSHNSASLDCPLHVRECERLASITEFTSKNLM